MKRLGIFVFYDRDGIVDACSEFYIKSLKSAVDDLVIVINGTVCDWGMRILEKYTNRILQRENIGFDAAAYKEALKSVILEEELDTIDELVLSNDTCYGPFVSFEEIFSKMEKQKVDFWGINFIDQKIVSFLESNFLVFRKQTIPDVKHYFENCIENGLTEVADVYVQFEIGLFQYLKKQGWEHGAYTDFSNLHIYISPNFCTKEYGYPFMKKKCFSSEYYHRDNCVDVLRFLQDNSAFDIGLILEHAKRKYSIDVKDGITQTQESLDLLRKNAFVTDRDRGEVFDFCKRNKAIYIYGAGIWARKIYSEFYADMSEFKGFVVSVGQTHADEIDGMPVYDLSQLESKDAGIIVAINPINTKEVKDGLQEFGNVLYLWDV